MSLQRVCHGYQHRHQLLNIKFNINFNDINRRSVPDNDTGDNTGAVTWRALTLTVPLSWWLNVQPAVSVDCKWQWASTTTKKRSQVASREDTVSATVTTRRNNIVRQLMRRMTITMMMILLPPTPYPQVRNGTCRSGELRTMVLCELGDEPSSKHQVVEVLFGMDGLVVRVGMSVDQTMNE